MKYFSMFSGIGGFEVGIKGRGECVGYSEIDKYAEAIYRKHFPEHRNYGDATKIRTEELPDFDLLVGGFPCQAFSVAGKRRGFDDARGTLFFEIARILKDKRPRYFLLENVKGLLSSKTYLPFENVLPILGRECRLSIWEKKNSPKVNWNMLNENLSIYIAEILRKTLDLEKIRLDISKTKNWESHYVEMETSLVNGMKTKLKFLKTELSRYLKKNNSFPTEVDQVLESNINEVIILLEDSLKENTSIKMDMSCYLKTTPLLNDAEKLLEKNLGENYPQLKLSTILMGLNPTIPQKICLYVQELNTINYIVKWRKSCLNYLKKELLNSMKNRESMYYVKTFNIILHELTQLGYNIQWQILNSKNFGVPQNRERIFIVGHLGGRGGRKIFPLEGKSREALKKVVNTGHDGTNVYSINGLAVTQKAMGGGQGAKTGLYAIPTTKEGNACCIDANYWKGCNDFKKGQRTQVAIPVLTPDRLNKRQNGRRFKTDGEPAFTCTAQDRHGVFDGYRIRRLTPTECERLQGFPDNWTNDGIFDDEIKEISDTQRYKCCGNAVTTNVIDAIISKMVEEFDDVFQIRNT